MNANVAIGQKDDGLQWLGSVVGKVGLATENKLEVLKTQATEATQIIKFGLLSKQQVVDRFARVVQIAGFVEEFGTDAVQSAMAPFDSASSFEVNAGTEARRDKVTSLDLQDFLSRTYPPRVSLLSPWLPVQGLAMMHGYRGFGKTLIAHGSAYAVAVGAGFLKWKAPEPRRVLTIDGEMPASDLQTRLRNLQDNSELRPEPGYFRIAAADTFRDGLPDLSNQSMQGFYSDVVADADFILLDNISTLCPGAKENDADGWAVMQAWILLLRRQGKSVLLIHHDGKGGQQRGTSKKEDVLDTVISLRRPPDYTADQGCRLEARFTKSRGFYGPDAEPFEARLSGNAWELSDIKSGDDDDTLKTLRKQGLTIRDIADRTGLSKSTVSRRLGDDE
jgi:putative DNA primase/helicase